MHKITTIPVELLNPQGPWAQEAANEAWTHPKHKKASPSLAQAAQEITAKELAIPPDKTDVSNKQQEIRTRLPIESISSTEFLAKAAKLRQSFAQLLERQKDLDVKRRKFVALAYDRLLQVSRNIVTDIDDRLKGIRTVQEERKEFEEWVQSLFNEVAMLIETDDGLISQPEFDSKPADESADKSETGNAQAVPATQQAGKHTRKRKYVVKPNDTLESIARKRLKNSNLASLIYQINQNILLLEVVASNSDAKLAPGLVLHLPSKAEVIEFKELVQESNGHGNSETV
jgi:LysM repeat protein